MNRWQEVLVRVRAFQLLEYQIWWGERLIWYSRVFGLCPPCIRATSLGGGYPSWWVGEVREPCTLGATKDLLSSVKIDDFLWVFNTVSLRSKPTHWEGSRALLAGGFAARASRSKPTLWEGFGSLPVGGFAAGGFCTEYSLKIINFHTKLSVFCGSNWVGLLGERKCKAPAPHPPARRDTSLPGVLPLCTVGRDQ